MILAFRRPCAAHQGALLDWLDRRATGSATGPALDHLERCPTCEGVLAEVSLAIVALRRIEADAAAVEPPADAWLRLRERLGRPVDPWRWRASLGGLATSAMLVAVLVLPVTIGGPADAAQAPRLPGAIAQLQRESRYLASIRDGSLPPSPRLGWEAGVPRIHPDEIAQVRKEVSSAKPTGRPPEPI